jgi:hypothetical protein
MRRLALNRKQLAAEAVVTQKPVTQKPLGDPSRGGFTALSEGIASQTWPLLRHFQFSIPAALPHPRQHRIAVALAAGLLASLVIAPVHAQSYPTQYLTTVWQTEQGLPQNSVTALLQDRDGYLWIGTFGGSPASMANASGFWTREGLRVSTTITFSLCTKVVPEYCGSVLWPAVSSGWKTALPPNTPTATACRAGSSTPSAEMPMGTSGPRPPGA